ncbi:MAG: Crp/Fnr family transcriptional regulator [Arcobacteraceae bacterium]|nr:Crp/Fnr family transcriptional regulator [Arcobacteraceae bacterium]
MIQQLQKLDLFNTLNNNELEQIVKISTIKNFQKDNIVFYEGDTPEYFYLLIDGFAKVYKVDPKGTEIVLHNFVGTTLIAEMASIEGFNFPATCICVEDSTFALIKKDEFLKILQTNAKISFKVTKSLTKKIKGMDGLLNRSLIFDATTKVASYIHDNPEVFKNKKNKIIATELHMTPETLSRILKKLKDLKIIDKEHNLLNKDKLEMFINF